MLIPIPTKSHAWFPLLIVCGALKPCFVTSPGSSRFSPNPIFLCSALPHQHSAAREKQLYFYIALGIISKIARLSVGTVCDILCACAVVPLCVHACVYIKPKRAQFAFWVPTWPCGGSCSKSKYLIVSCKLNNLLWSYWRRLNLKCRDYYTTFVKRAHPPVTEINWALNSFQIYVSSYWQL